MNLPRTKWVYKNLPFIIFAAIFARLIKDVCLSFFDLNYNPLRDDFDLLKWLINWAVLGFLFFGMLFLRGTVWKRNER